MRFLIFEDNPDTGVFYRRNLARMFDSDPTFVVQVVTSINEGFSVLSSFRPRTIFLDLRIPPLGPDEVIARIPELAAVADVLVVSEAVEDHYIEAAMMAGANDFIPKPLMFDASTGDGRLGIIRMLSRIGASYYRSKRDHGS